ncbi:prophage tail fiber N-terminal domain-containing protein [Salmonella enterica]|nr:prophage tail fiber N-terminal domain-containing protein [Salmonella enterica]
MSVQISGVLKDGAGIPIKTCKIELRSVRTSKTVIVQTVASVTTDEAGAYQINAEPGRYAVVLNIEGYPVARAGEISVYENSVPGSLNDFLLQLTEDDLKPDVIRRFETMCEQVARQAEEAEKNRARAEESATQAAQSAGTAGDAVAQAKVCRDDVFGIRDELRQEISDAVRAGILATAQGDDLDRIGKDFEVARLEGEPDDAYRERIRLSWGRLNSAGSENAYRYYALTADPDVLDARAYGPDIHHQPGQIHLYVLSRTGNGEAPQALLDKVAAAVNQPDVRPVTDQVLVRSAVNVGYDVVARVSVPKGAAGDKILKAVRAAVETSVSLSHRTGTSVSTRWLDGVLRQTGVTGLERESPADDVICVAGQAPYCSRVSVERMP